MKNQNQTKKEKENLMRKNKYGIMKTGKDCYSLLNYETGEYIVVNDTMTVCSNVKESLENPIYSEQSECYEIAEKYMVNELKKEFRELIDFRGHSGEIKSWDNCFTFTCTKCGMEASGIIPIPGKEKFQCFGEAIAMHCK
jgi:hypothetical protein